MLTLAEIILGTNSDKNTRHSYVDHYYEQAFAPYRHRGITLLEIGVYRADSLIAWRKYFNDATIYGLDIHIPRKWRQRLSDVHWIEASQTDPEAVKHVSDLDIVIDDGSHRIDDQLASFEILWPKIKPGGLYVIEDIEDIGSHANIFRSLDDSCEIVDLRHIKNRHDDVIVQFKKIQEHGPCH